MDEDGKNIEKIGHFNIGSALHPTIFKDGRVMFSSYEAQGLRDQRIWGLWAIWPDGRKWGPLMSGFTDAAAFHFQTQLSNEHLAVVEYYNQNNNGFGTLLAFPQAAGQHALVWRPRPSHPSIPVPARHLVLRSRTSLAPPATLQELSVLTLRTVSSERVHSWRGRSLFAGPGWQLGWKGDPSQRRSKQRRALGMVPGPRQRSGSTHQPPPMMRDSI